MIDYEKLEKAWKLMGEVLKENELRKLDEKIKELTKPEPKYRESQRVWFIDCTHHDGPIKDGLVERQELVEGLFGSQDYVVHIGDLIIPVDCVYPSREALIEAQIEYWQGLQDDPITDEGTKKYYTGFGFVKKEHLPCEHESDGVVIKTCNALADTNDKTRTYKCKHCEEFYR
jgi:hypothetical protein